MNGIADRGGGGGCVRKEVLCKSEAGFLCVMYTKGKVQRWDYIKQPLVKLKVHRWPVPSFPSNPFGHGLLNYKDTNTICRHLKKLTCKGTLRQVFSGIYRLLVFSTQLLNYCPCNLLSSSPPPPRVSPKVQTVCGWLRSGWGPQTDEHLPQSHFTGKFF